MTTLLAHFDEKSKRGYMAADRRWSFGNEIASESYAKIYRAGKWLVGVTGSSLASNLVEQNLDALSGSGSAWEFCQTLRKVFTDYGWSGSPPEGGEAPCIDASFLLVSPEGSWLVFSNFSPLKQDRPCSVGSGGAYAVGAFLGILKSMPAPEFSIAPAMELAIRTACVFDRCSGGEPQVEVTE